MAFAVAGVACGSTEASDMPNGDDEQIAAGVDGLVPVGTTGESPTLTMQEHIHVIEVVIEAAAKRVPEIAGTGSNS